MSAVIEAISDVVEGIFDLVGDVVEAVVDFAEKVIDVVAENPWLIVAAIAAPYALSALAAETAVIGVATAAETAIAAEAFAGTISAFEVVGAAEAITSGVAVLEATGAATAVASAEAVAATTLIEAGATVEAATAGASLVAEGATVAEAVSAASSGTVGTSSIVEAASGAWDTLSQAAQNLTQSIGETLVPGADSSIQKIVGQVAQNTVTNGGDFQKAVESSFLSFGTGALGSQVADITGSDMAGRVASNATRQLAKTGDVNLAGLAGSELGRYVGSEVAEETGSALAGKAAASVAGSTLAGKDAKTGLLKLGINEGVNSAFGAASDLFGAPEAETAEQISGEENKRTVDAASPAALDDSSEGLGSVSDDSKFTLDESDDAQKAKFGDNFDDGSKDLSDIVNEGADVKEPAAKPDVLAEIEKITASDDDKNLQAPRSMAPTVAPTEPAGGLNVIQKTQPQVDPITGEVTGSSFGVPLSGSGIVTNLLKGKVTGALNEAILPPPPPKKKVAKAPVGGLNAVKAPPKRVDVSTLTPIAKAPVKKKVAPTTTAKPMATSSPVANISGLSSLLGTGG